MGALRGKRDKIPECVVRGLRLWESPIRLLLRSMDQIRKFDRVLDEENRDVVSHQVPVAFLRIELDCKSAHVARHIGGTGISGHGRETHKYWSFFSHFTEHSCLGKLLQGVRKFKEAVGCRAPRMDNALRNTLMIEVVDLLPKNKVF